jgi:dolichol-phosphate mannosyltransferase
VPDSVVIVPTFNESDNLPDLIDRIQSFGNRIQLLIVDDNSPDGTGRRADEIAARMQWVHVLHRIGKLGLGTAYIQGFQWAMTQGAEFIFSMDGDLSHEPKYLPDLWKLLENVDVVVGSRYLNGISVVNWPLNRILLSYFANKYIRAMTGLHVNDCTSGFVGYHRRVLERIQFGSLRSEGYAFLIEMKYRAQQSGFTIGEVPIIFFDRRMGQSKLSKYVMFEAFRLPWRLAYTRLLGRERFG